MVAGLVNKVVKLEYIILAYQKSEHFQILSSLEQL